MPTLFASLDATEQQAAVRGSSAIDLVLGPGQDGKTIASEGLVASKMTSDQQAALLKVIAHYTGLVNDVDATSRRAEITANRAKTYFAWFGPTTAGSAAYFRVTGPTWSSSTPRRERDAVEQVSPASTTCTASTAIRPTTTA